MANRFKDLKISDLQGFLFRGTISALALVGFSQVALTGSDSPVLPDVGSGDVNLFVWMKQDLTEYRIVRFVGKEKPDESSFAAGALKSNLTPVYPFGSSVLWGMPLQHCYPLGDGSAFLRQWTYNFKVPLSEKPHQIGDSTSELMNRSAELITIVPSGDHFVVREVQDSSLAVKYGIDAGSQFLGELDNYVFYWSEGTSEAIFAKDIRNKRVYSWNIPGLYLANGILRGSSASFTLIAYRRAVPYTPQTPYSEGHLVNIGISLAEAKQLTDSTSPP